MGIFYENLRGRRVFCTILFGPWNWLVKKHKKEKKSSLLSNSSESLLNIEYSPFFFSNLAIKIVTLCVMVFCDQANSSIDATLKRKYSLLCFLVSDKSLLKRKQTKYSFILMHFCSRKKYLIIIFLWKNKNCSFKSLFKAVIFFF